jgi:tetratricopeptide (TPR) repeat protein
MRALGVLHGRGIRWREADCFLLLGDIAWQEGDADGAETWWGQALTLHRALQTRYIPVIEARMALSEISRGHFDEARRALEVALSTLERRGQRGVVSAVHAWLLPCYAALGAWGAFDAHLAVASELLQEIGTVDVFIARTAMLGGDLAYATGQHARARMAWSLALEQWLMLGWRAEIRALKYLLREDQPSAGGEPA